MNNILVKLQNNPEYALICAVFLLVLICYICFKAGEIFSRLVYGKSIKEARADAINRSRAVLEGLAVEQIAPFLPDFPCSPADCRFVGKPLDFVAFPKTADGEIKEILLIEVKTGDSQLNQREKEIRTCVEKGRIRYIEYRLENTD